MAEYKHDQSIDVTKEICPMTFVKTKLKLATMEKGQILEVSLREGESLANLPKSIKQDGHKILEIYMTDSHLYKILIERC